MSCDNNSNNMFIRFVADRCSETSSHSASVYKHTRSICCSRTPLPGGEEQENVLLRVFTCYSKTPETEAATIKQGRSTNILTCWREMIQIIQIIQIRRKQTWQKCVFVFSNSILYFTVTLFPVSQTRDLLTMGRHCVAVSSIIDYYYYCYCHHLQS